MEGTEEGAKGKGSTSECKALGTAAAAAGGVDTADCPEPEPALETKSEEAPEENQEEDSTETRPTEHTVKERETVNSIAALYDLTPSEMAQANKLGMSRLVFPGQVLRVPAPPPPPPPPDLEREKREQMDIIEYQFIKLKVRHITLGRGVVMGSVLFTPNAVIFDPDPKDPLVEELEPEAFQIIAPMEFVVNAAIFLDFFPIGSTGKCEGKERPPSDFYQGPKKKKKEKEGRGLQRRESTGSGYSLCREMEDRAKAEEEEEEEEDKVRPEPYYLRLTMGKPVQREMARSTPTMAYGQQTMMPEYWFIVPSAQAANLYNFLQCWFPEIYSPFDLEEVHEMGFELVPEPDLSIKEEGDTVGSLNTASSRKMIHKTMTLNSIDMDMLLPDLDFPSQLVSDDQRKLLHRHLPPRLQGYEWHRLFCTEQDGFSLANLYRRAADTDSPVLLVIQDTEHAVFGALISSPPRQSEAFMGTGESWLFTFFPSFKVYSWTGENNYIVRGASSNLVIGSSDGGFGIWLDESFNQGRSQAVSTFGNKPLPGREDFIVNNVECWTFH